MIVKYLYVYILRCSDGVYYTGVTNNPQRRLLEHNAGRNETAFTYRRRPVEMLYCEGFTDFDFAILWEKKIKDWSKKKKEALIKENWDELKTAAVCQNDSHFRKRFSTPLEETSACSSIGLVSSSVAYASSNVAEVSSSEVENSSHAFSASSTTHVSSSEAEVSSSVVGVSSSVVENHP
jgi:putative endonuclease